MKNVGKPDRIIRIILGIGILSLRVLFDWSGKVLGINWFDSSADRIVWLLPNLLPVENQHREEGISL